MSSCDYCCVRPSSLSLSCVRCHSSRLVKICFQCSTHVHLFLSHHHQHPQSTFQLLDLPLNVCDVCPPSGCSSWLCEDELVLIEMVETCGLGNWLEIGKRVRREERECREHFEEMYFSPSRRSLSVSFSSFSCSSSVGRRLLLGEEQINGRSRDLSSSSIIYPLMFINREEQKLLTYMPMRDEYERELSNQAESRLPSELTLNDGEDQCSSVLPSSSSSEVFDEQDRAKVLHQAKLTLCRSYGQILRRRFQLKHFIRDYSLAFDQQHHEEQQQQQQFDLHQICRFLSADQYERLIYNHRKIRRLLEELGCSTSSRPSSDCLDPSCDVVVGSSSNVFVTTKSKKCSTSSSASPRKAKRTTRQTNQRQRQANNEEEEEEEEEEVEEECRSPSLSSSSVESSLCRSSSGSSSLSPSNISFSSLDDQFQLNNNLKRRSVRRVSSSSSSSSSLVSPSSSKVHSVEPLYKRRRLSPDADHQTCSSLRLRRSRGPTFLGTSDVSWDSLDRDQSNPLSDGPLNDQHSSAVSSRTRSHTPPISGRRHRHRHQHRRKCSPNGKGMSSSDLNGSSTKTCRFDPLSQSTSASHRMLTRHQLVLQQTSPKKRRRIASNSLDEQSNHC